MSECQSQCEHGGSHLDHVWSVESRSMVQSCEPRKICRPDKSAGLFVGSSTRARCCHPKNRPRSANLEQRCRPESVNNPRMQFRAQTQRQCRECSQRGFVEPRVTHATSGGLAAGSQGCSSPADRALLCLGAVVVAALQSRTLPPTLVWQSQRGESSRRPHSAAARTTETSAWRRKAAGPHPPRIDRSPTQECARVQC